MSLFLLREELATGGGVQIEILFQVFIVAPIFVYAKGYPSIHTFLGVYALEYIAYTAAPPMIPLQVYLSNKVATNIYTVIKKKTNLAVFLITRLFLTQFQSNF